jgi:hypothetical protein
MTALRLAFVMLVCIAGLSAAQQGPNGGSFNRCPAPQSSTEDYFGATGKSSCDAYKFCATTRCQCNGGSYNNNTLNCVVSPVGKTCTDVKPCQTLFVQCLQLYSANAACLNDLKVAIVNVLAGTTYNGSAVDLACRAETCRYFNLTSGTNCTIAYSDICFLAGAVTTGPGELQFTGRLLLNGNYVSIIIDPTNLFLFIQALNFDLTAKLEVKSNVTSVTAQSALIIFTSAISPTNAAFLARLNAAAADPSWLTSTRLAFERLGGTGTFGLLSLGAASAASSSVAMWAAIVAVVLAIFA